MCWMFDWCSFHRRTAGYIPLSGRQRGERQSNTSALFLLPTMQNRTSRDWDWSRGIARSCILPYGWLSREETHSLYCLTWFISLQQISKTKGKGTFFTSAIWNVHRHDSVRHFDVFLVSSWLFVLGSAQHPWFPWRTKSKTVGRAVEHHAYYRWVIEWQWTSPEWETLESGLSIEFHLWRFLSGLVKRKLENAAPLSLVTHERWAWHSWLLVSVESLDRIRSVLVLLRFLLVAICPPGLISSFERSCAWDLRPILGCPRARGCRSLSKRSARENTRMIGRLERRVSRDGNVVHLIHPCSKGRYGIEQDQRGHRIFPTRSSLVDHGIGSDRLWTRGPRDANHVSTGMSTTDEEVDSTLWTWSLNKSFDVDLVWRVSFDFSLSLCIKKKGANTRWLSWHTFTTTHKLNMYKKNERETEKQQGEQRMPPCHHHCTRIEDILLRFYLQCSDSHLRPSGKPVPCNAEQGMIE